MHAGEARLRSATLTPSSDSFGPASIPWSELGQPPPPVLFVLSGRGEVAVTLGLEFVPAELRPSPVSRGIEVRKVLRRRDAATGLPTGPPLSAVALGATVVVTLEVTIHDELTDIQVRCELLVG